MEIESRPTRESVRFRDIASGQPFWLFCHTKSAPSEGTLFIKTEVLAETVQEYALNLHSGALTIMLDSDLVIPDYRAVIRFD